MALRFVSRETVAVSTTAIGLTAAKVTTAVMMATVQVLTANVRVTFGGNDPTTSLGYQWQSGDVMEVWGQPDLLSFRAIRDDATDAALEVEYFGTA